MKIDRVLADTCFTILVDRVRAKDEEWLRFAFGYAVCELELEEYGFDSCLGPTARFCNRRQGIPHLSCKELDSMTQVILEQANHEISEIFQIKTAITIKRIPIKTRSKPKIIPVVPSIERLRAISPEPQTSL